jgi:predicted alpha/beta-hydrolase family hydrolase
VPYTAPPMKWDHELIIGDTYQPATVQLVDADDVAYPLDGATGECQIRTEPGGELLLSPTVTVDGTTDTFTWSSAVAATAVLLPQRAKYSLRLTFSDGSKRTVLEGVVTIRRSVVS